MATAIITFLIALLPALLEVLKILEAKWAAEQTPEAQFQRAEKDANALVANPDTTQLAARLSELHDKASRRRLTGRSDPPAGV